MEENFATSFKIKDFELSFAITLKISLVYYREHFANLVILQSFKLTPCEMFPLYGITYITLCSYFADIQGTLLTVWREQT